MSNPTKEKTDALPLSEQIRTYAPWIFAAIILVGYGWIINYLMMRTTVSNEEWLKLTYIFSSVEAIVFTVIGFIFGREVNRSRAIRAEQGEAKAEKDKKVLAREVLKHLPSPISTSEAMQAESQDLVKLRNMAETYLVE